MDIKGLTRNVIPFITVKKKDANAAKLDADNEKEGNGQTGGEGRKPRKLSEDEVKDAVKFFEALPGVKENNLNVRLEMKDGVTVIYIEDRTGKVVRRIPESEISALTANREKKTGGLLNRAM